MYDQFSDDYDRFVNWENRLAFEMPLLEKLLAPLQRGEQPARVLDAACATGMHAIELARRGWNASGGDISQGMIDIARSNAARGSVTVRFEAAGFGSLAGVFGTSNQDAALCLGNSLPHVLTMTELESTLRDFADCLRPGGLLILQNRNFDKILASRDRWIEPQAAQSEEGEWIFIRFYDYLPTGLINFNIVSLRRSRSGWQQTIHSTHLYPLCQTELLDLLHKAGFNEVQSFGSMDGSPFDAAVSENLIVCAKKR